jgi:hypothetical protein
VDILAVLNLWTPFDPGGTPAAPSVGSVTLAATAVSATLSAAALGTVTLEVDN